MHSKEVILIGNSGHALVIHEILVQLGYKPIAYLAPKKIENPLLQLEYWGSEENDQVVEKLHQLSYFIAIGDNGLRERVFRNLIKKGIPDPITIISTTAYVSPLAHIGSGSLIGTGSIIHPGTTIGRGCIINTGSIVDHDCQLGDFVHVAPGAVLCGNVFVKKGALIGAGSTIIPNIAIGKWATIGAGTVVIQDIKDNRAVVGNPARIIS